MKRSLLLTLICLALALLVPSFTVAQTECGPVILAGHDADDHGFIGIYAGLFDQVQSNTTIAGSGILAIGADETSTSGNWIKSIAANMVPPQIVFFVNDIDILTRPFVGFSILFVPSDDGDVSGGITQAENDMLNFRKSDIADFINLGGGLVGLTHGQLIDGWDYISGLAPLVTLDAPSSGRLPSGDLFEDISTTPEGLDLGITDDNIDGCCFHNAFDTFPAFFQTLATVNAPNDPGWDGKAVFIGGTSTCILPFCGDGVLDPGEECDDGNTDPNDGCSSICENEFVGTCVSTQGFWKNHHRFRKNPSQQLPWPTDELTDLCGETWLDILYVHPRGNAWYILAHQWIAATLNVGTNVPTNQEVLDALAEAELLLANCSIDAADRARAIELSELLDEYNNGRLGTPHCDDDTARRAQRELRRSQTTFAVPTIDTSTSGTIE